MYQIFYNRCSTQFNTFFTSNTFLGTAFDLQREIKKVYLIFQIAKFTVG